MRKAHWALGASWAVFVICHLTQKGNDTFDLDKF